jgi:RNA polymerase sigma factor (sigma-70 family)
MQEAPDVSGSSFIEMSVTELVAAAKQGDQNAWATLVEQYQPLVHAVCSRFRLSKSDVEDASQTVWLQLVRNLDKLRDARALPGWIETTTTNTCLALLKALNREVPRDPHGLGGETRSPWDRPCQQSELDEALLSQESRHAIQRGLVELPSKQQELLRLLAADPPMTYRQISQQLGMPVGSIGPTRARSIQNLRNTASVRGMLTADAATQTKAA